MPMVRDIIPAEGWIPRSASIVMIAGTPICDTTRQLRWVIPMSIAQPGSTEWSHAPAPAGRRSP